MSYQPTGSSGTIRLAIRYRATTAPKLQNAATTTASRIIVASKPNHWAKPPHNPESFLSFLERYSLLIPSSLAFSFLLFSYVFMIASREALQNGPKTVCRLDLGRGLCSALETGKNGIEGSDLVKCILKICKTSYNNKRAFLEIFREIK